MNLFLELLFTLRAAGTRFRHISHFLEIQLSLPTHFISQISLLIKLLSHDIVVMVEFEVFRFPQDILSAIVGLLGLEFAYFLF